MHNTVYTVRDRSCTLVLVYIQLAIQCKKKHTFFVRPPDTTILFVVQYPKWHWQNPHCLSLSLLIPKETKLGHGGGKPSISQVPNYFFFLNSRSPRGVAQPWLLAEPGQHPRGPRRLLRVQGQGEPAAPQARVDAQRK